MVWRREEYIAHMNHQYTGKEMFCELFGPLKQLEDEWKENGATPDEISLDAFGWDHVMWEWMPVITGALSHLQEQVLEDNDEYRIIIDKKGRKSKLCKKSATIPLPIDFPVKDWDDWLKIKHWYEFSEERINTEKLLEMKNKRENGTLTVFGIPGGFDELRELMGEENLCYAYYEDPELLEDILNTIGDTCVKVMERVLEICGIDDIFVHEDLAGKSGPLIGPKQIEEFIKPYYQKVFSVAKASGTTLFSMDSDGNMNSVMDNFIDAGINVFMPMEPAAGMDIVELKKKYGNKIAIKGGIDKHVLYKTKEDIRKELEYKICDVTKGGGVIFAIDHRIPNGVSLENYWYYVTLARELLGLPPAQKSDYKQMAF